MMLHADPLQPGDYNRTVTVGELNRSYLVHVPPGYDGSKPTPVVLAFHGGGVNAEQLVAFCGLNEKSDEAGFIAVYPSGTGRVPHALTWNAGNCCGYAMQNNVDDVGFTRALLDDLAQAAAVDARRVFATGMSNGGMICYRLASELSDRIAAVAAVGGPMGTETCSPKRPVSVIHFHGTLDLFAPFHGGKGERSASGTSFLSVEHTIGAWVTANGCPETPTVAQEPNKSGDGMTVERRTYGPGNGGAEVVLIAIEGGGHTWPGRQPRFALLGKSTKDISANDVMWEFFQRHPMT
ncbi:MAG TPA: PHB depolymerase family esterase [Pirellulales bacterium]|nr:PHB depolymerase family esterase [Pirellulales bacterium]